MAKSKADTDKKWGDLANKMGMITEDLVAPSVPCMLREMIGCPEGGIESIALRVSRSHPTISKRTGEFDVVAMCGEYVLINETKSSLYADDIKDFVGKLSQAREFFPEYADKKFIDAVASLRVSDNLVQYGEKLGLIVLGFGEGAMMVLNRPDFSPKAF